MGVEFSVIVETRTFDESGDRVRLWAVLRSAVDLLPEDGSGEVLLADSCDSAELQELLGKEFPEVRRVAANGLGYDGAKMLAAQAAAGCYLLFLDGDCLPQPGWQQSLLEPLRSGKAVACGGFTRYEGGWLGALLTVMDFGFLLPRVRRPLKCYASNNCAFLRETLEQVPIPGGDLRCRCFYHAQRLLRRGTPMLLIPEARVLHESQPLVRERTRQGYDCIAACWADPELPEARWLRLGLLSIPLFYAARVAFDWKRVWLGRRDLGLASWHLLLCFPLFPLLRCLDAAGMARALVAGPVQGGWDGWLPKRRTGGVRIQRGPLLRAAAILGRRRLGSMVRAGLPERLAAPLRYLLDGAAEAGSAPLLRKIEGIRDELAARGEESMAVCRQGPAGPAPVRSMRFIARVASVPPAWGALLHQLAAAGQAETILELGSCAGISGCYLASARDCRRFITVEGALELARLAEQNLRRVVRHAEVIHASFDEALDRLLPALPRGLDMVFIDGSKSHPDNLRWVERLLPHLSEGALIVLDDIHFSAEMEHAWQSVRRMPGFSHAVDAGRFGLCLWRGGPVLAQDDELFRLAGLNLPRVHRLLQRRP